MTTLTNEADFNVSAEAEDRDDAEASKSQKICLSCGAEQNDDGSLPCGHDNDL
ncbi:MULTISPECIES: hypothetical protein [unclassified Caballeronia]|uniref:hypothetical protein n=1 Tax=unclassified Caballeronia TaxID=2646786 RepID=UPI0028619F3B|nr:MULTISPECIES: hypothetical protein [unclassified Caballeronia]MDR5776508.1 hypothetical protein [Caballeronia sp. LZ002]MDR5851949.1 hypothetical protein [Caballeronia sp. LZ003]